MIPIGDESWKGRESIVLFGAISTTEFNLAVPKAIPQKPEMEDLWRTEARTDEQAHFEEEGYRPWIFIEPRDRVSLAMEVGSKLFGLPLQPRTEENSFTGYSSQELQFIEAICEQLTKHFKFDVEGILFACIFVHVHVDESTVKLPIFKARAVSSNSTIFVDTQNRTYVSWEDWKQHEKLPAGSYCAPSGGFYEADSDGNVKLTFENSLACKTSTRVAGLLKAVFTATDIGGSVLPKIFPQTAPFFRFASVAARGFDIGESSNELYGRATHGQSIGLGDKEARKRWLTLLYSTLGPAAGIAESRLQTSMNASKAAGKAVDPKIRMAATSAKFAGVAINTLRVGEIIYDVSEQFQNRKNLSGNKSKI